VVDYAKLSQEDFFHIPTLDTLFETLPLFNLKDDIGENPNYDIAIDLCSREKE